MDGCVGAAKGFSLPGRVLELHPRAARLRPEFRQNPSSTSRRSGPTNPQLRSVVDRSELLLPLCVQQALYRRPLRENSQNHRNQSFSRIVMALTDSNVLKLAPDAATPAYRSAPHNIEAEQSLLGAILVNNDAFYRVSDFLEPKHYFEPLHQTIFETAGSLIRMGKVATPDTMKTFLPADTDIGGMTVGQYLARVAAEATTIINAQDYGRTIYDMALRRDLIRIGEDMVNVAFDAPVDFAPRAQIEDAERQLYELAESGRYDGGFQRFSQAMKVALDMAANAYQRDGKLSGISTGLRDLDSKMGGLQRSDLIIVAGRPGMGKTALATNIAYNIAEAHQAEVQADGTMKSVNGGIVGFFSCEMSAEQLATRILADQTSIASSMIRRGGITEA